MWEVDENWDGNWGRFQRNRRYDGQIYLDWNTDAPGQDAAAPANQEDRPGPQ